MPIIYEGCSCASCSKQRRRSDKTYFKPKDYGKCGLIRHHKIIQNKHGQFCCKYCGKTLLTLEKELRQEQKRIEDEVRKERDRNIYSFFFGK